MVADSTIRSTGISDEEMACVDFYRSMQESVEEEPLYYARLADRIEQLGHADAAAILQDLAAQWEVGYWEPEPGEEDPELAMSAQLAEAGTLLGSEGHIRCADLSEAWGVEGYRGEPSDREISERQRQIWTANGVKTYRLLIVVVDGGGGPVFQYHVDVVDGQTERVFDAQTEEPIDAGNLDVPLTVDEIYAEMSSGGRLATRYDLVYGGPTYVGQLLIEFDLKDFPQPMEVLVEN
jgi:hypothetical protein